MDTNMNTNKTRTIITVLVCLILVIGIVAAFMSSKNEVQAPVQDQVNDPTQSLDTVPATTTKAYTLSEVATHNSTTSCWAAVNSNVYDLTTWIGQHPGGEEAIKSICGKDGSAAFNGQHGGQENPEKALASFIIGTLK